MKGINATPFEMEGTPIAGAAGGVAYEIAAGFLSPPVLVARKVIGPAPVGVIVNVSGTEERLKFNTIGTERLPPDGTIVIVPEYALSGVTTNGAEGLFSGPPAGPVSVKDDAVGVAAAGVTGLLEAAVDAPLPEGLIVCTARSYGVPFTRPLTMQAVADGGQLFVMAVPPECGTAVARNPVTPEPPIGVPVLKLIVA